RYMEAGVDLGPGRKVTLLPLTATRRFGASLARAAGRLAGKAYASECAHSTTLVCHRYPDDDPAQGAAQLLAETLSWKTQARGRLDGLAILLRHSHQSVAIENGLIRAELPYLTLGFESYLMQPEVLLVRALLAVALNDFESLEAEATRRRLVRALVFFCGVELSFDHREEETADERLDEAVHHVARDAVSLGPFFDYQVLQRGDAAMARRLRAAIAVARDVRGPDMFARLLDALQMETLVRTVFVEKARRRDALAYMGGLARAAREFNSARDFFASLNRAETRAVATGSALRNASRAAALKKTTLTLATVAAVKGLEFEHVMMPGLVQGEFPSSSGSTDLEERNLFYVGMTRARRALTLFAGARRPSEFLAAAGLAPAGETVR
ncbi:MAG: ATP-binding domain-containing protein, partial [Pseudomonadota bacterium]|nr:ATP-binding domain-containing protein [Pseudomonadota bacterium]